MINVNNLLNLLKTGKIDAAIEELEWFSGAIFFAAVSPEDVTYDLVDNPEELTKEQVLILDTLIDEHLAEIAEKMSDSFSEDYPLYLTEAIKETSLENPFDEDMNDKDEDDVQSDEETD